MMRFFRILLLCSVAAPASHAQVYDKLRTWAEEQRRAIQERMEASRWNKILTSDNPRFNTKPNSFLMEMTKGRTPGRALDVGMGQGRNAIYLAKQNWQVTGFDPAGKAVALAQKRAAEDGVKLTALITTDSKFDFSDSQWDLVVMSYVGVREIAERVKRSLKPGGIVVVEAFHRDALQQSPVGSAVVFESNELLKIFSGMRVLRYEDVDAIGDFGLKRTRVVRFCGQK